MDALSGVDDIKVMNEAPIDLDNAATSILQMCQAQYVEERIDTEEEEEEGEEVQGQDSFENSRNAMGTDQEGLTSDDDVSAQYQKLLKEMRAEVDYEEDMDDT